MCSIQTAEYFCKFWHHGQTRKYTGEAYHTHPIAVAKILEDDGFDRRVIISALLHDVLEDTACTEEEIEKVFGRSVLNLVLEVTDVSIHVTGNRAFRKELDRKHLAKTSRAGASLKLADLIHNTSSILEHDGNFAKIYMREKRLLLQVLKHGRPSLLKRATELVDNYFNIRS